MTPYASSTIFGYPMIQRTKYMQNNRNRSDFADAHTDLSADVVMPLKYLIMKNYRHVYLYIYRFAKTEARARV